MKMSELILAVGDENVQFQPLDRCLISLDYPVNGGAKIFFGTEQPVTPTGTERMGIIIWLDRDAVKKALEPKS